MLSSDPPAPGGRAIVGDPQWKLFTQDGYLIATAGGDETWVVDDVAGDVIDELAACWSDSPPTPDQLSRPAALAVEQLRAVGVFGPLSTIGAPPRLGVVFSGDPVPGFAAALAARCRDHGWPEPSIDTQEAADLLVVLRSNATLARTAELAGELLSQDRIHLLCDLAARRTIVLGPFVVPGHTACVGCLTGRIANRWGDPPVPSQPGATGSDGATIAAGLVAHQARIAAEDGRYPLVDATTSLDLDSLIMDTGPCLRLPQCPYCAASGARRSDGRVSLPWAP